MAKEYFMDEVAVLKKIVQEAGRMREYSENEMSDLIDHKIQERIEWARQNDEGLYWYYQNLSFKDKKTLIYSDRICRRSWDSRQDHYGPGYHGGHDQWI